MQVEKREKLEAQQAAADARQEAANKVGIISMLQTQLKAPIQVGNSHGHVLNLNKPTA